jgi:hypothetical protein
VPVKLPALAKPKTTVALKINVFSMCDVLRSDFVASEEHAKPD